MKKLIVISLFIGIFFPSSIFAENRNWSSDRATLTPKGRFESGVFGPTRYGLTQGVELESHPLLFLIMPNVSAKVALEDQGRWRIASRHSVNIPTFLLRVLSREGTGGVLPKNAQVPFMLSIGNALVASMELEKEQWFTIEGGFVFTPSFGDKDFPEIELPLIYLRTASYHAPISVHASLTLEGAFSSQFYYSLQSKGLLAPGYNGGFSAEQHGKLIWRPHENFQLEVGVMTAFTKYPRFARLNAFPLFDIEFAF